MAYPTKIRWKRLGWLTILGLLLSPLLGYGMLLLLRPPRTEETRVLFQGVTYQRLVRSTPRPIVAHVVTVDLTAPGIKLLVTPGNPTADGMDINARMTTEFAQAFKVQLAINANFFQPFYERNPLDFYPRSGDRVEILGLSISDGDTYSPRQGGWNVLCVSDQQRVQIPKATRCPANTTQAVAGSGVFINQGKPAKLDQDSPSHREIYPRTLVGTDQTGEKLWLVAIDGRQPFYSEGLSVDEMSNFMLELGVYTALNLDGGGSTTLVAAEDRGYRTLNSPIHTRIPLRQRPVANHIGIYALPLQP